MSQVDSTPSFSGLSTRAKTLLLGGAAFFIVLLLLAVTWLFQSEAVVSDQPMAGTTFESIDDFRSQVVARDDRDIRADGSVSFRSIIQPHESDLIIYTLRPNLNVRFQSVPLMTNSFGMRDKEIVVEKPEDTYRIALLGDSFAFGWGVEEEKSFARVVEREINRRTNGSPKVEVLNFGVPGYSTFQEVALYEELALQFSPDAVIVYFVENDFGLPFFVKNANAPGEIVSNRQFSKQRKQAVEDEVKQQHQRLLRNLDANRALRKLAEINGRIGVKSFVIVNPGKTWKRDEKKLWSSAKLENLEVLGIFEPVQAKIDARGHKPEELRLPNDPHPSALRHGILGEVIVDEIYAKLELGD